jgi:Ig-like domain-containing protein
MRPQPKCPLRIRHDHGAEDGTRASNMPRAMRHRFAACLWATVLALSLILNGCGPVATPTFFIPPTAEPNTSGGGLTQDLSTPGATGTAELIVPTLVLPTPTPPCTDGLTYEQDLTIPDGANVAPGQLIDKQWQVSNSGTCNWDDRYRLKLIGGEAMGANPLQPLYPARAGTQATLRILFTAPPSAGLYMCQWQAVNPDGIAFGDAFYMQISVVP